MPSGQILPPREEAVIKHLMLWSRVQHPYQILSKRMHLRHDENMGDSFVKSYLIVFFFIFFFVFRRWPSGHWKPEQPAHLISVSPPTARAKRLEKEGKTATRKQQTKTPDPSSHSPHNSQLPGRSMEMACVNAGLTALIPESCFSKPPQANATALAPTASAAGQ